MCEAIRKGCLGNCEVIREDLHGQSLPDLMPLETLLKSAYVYLSLQGYPQNFYILTFTMFSCNVCCKFYQFQIEIKGMMLVLTHSSYLMFGMLILDLTCAYAVFQPASRPAEGATHLRQ